MGAHDSFAGVSSSDALAILAFVAPGFLVVYLVANFRGRRISNNALILGLSSILISGFLGLFFLAWNGLDSGSEALAFILDHPLVTAFQFLILALTASACAALFEEFNPIRKGFRWLVRTAKGREARAQSVWDSYTSDHLDAPVVVEARDGRLIGGFLRRHSEQEEGEPPALVLVKPALVRRDESGVLSGIGLGRSILLQQDDIRSIVVLEGPKVDGTPQPDLSVSAGSTPD